MSFLLEHPLYVVIFPINNPNKIIEGPFVEGVVSTFPCLKIEKLKKLEGELKEIPHKKLSKIFSDTALESEELKSFLLHFMSLLIQEYQKRE